MAAGVGLAAGMLAQLSCAGSQDATAPSQLADVVSAPPGAGATLTRLVLSPSNTSTALGHAKQFTLTATWSDGSTSLPAVTYDATGGTVSATGLYTPGTVVGKFRVIVRQQGGTRADTSTIAVNPNLRSMSMTPGSVTLAPGQTQQFTVTGTYSDGSHSPAAVTYASTGGSITSTGLFAAGSAAGTFRVIAVHLGGSMADTSTVTIRSSSSTTLLQEGFEDQSFASRGWFDMTGALATTTTEHSTGSHALEWHWTKGAVKPANSAGRHDITPTNSVYLSYWVKQSTNWTGSGVNYDPHMFYLLTNIDAPAGATPGLSRTHLTVYNELNYVVGAGGSRAHAAMQDALNINSSYLNQDVSPGHSPTMENRSVSGYNGVPENSPQMYAFLDDYSSGGLLFNGKWWASNYPAPGTLVMTDATKNSWHHIEAYHQLNTVSGGIGQRDGVLQFWYDGKLLVDRHDIYYRTGQYPAMKFSQLVMAPYMSPNSGTGSPVDQSMWIDDLVIATAKP